jgi:hypothetical protein
MKKLLLFLLLLLPFGVQRISAQDFSTAQLQLRTDIETFLKEEGFMPEIDSDGDIKFKREGVKYYVKIYEKDKSPMYLALFAQFNYPSDYPKDIAKMATIELNFYKGVKVLCFDDYVRYQSDMYLKDAETFKLVFYKLINQLTNARQDMNEECAKLQKTKQI